MIFPNRLNKDDTIGIIAPSSSFDRSRIEDVRRTLKNLGYKTEIGKSCYEKYKGYLAGTDELRASDIEHMFLNKNIKGILCMRGGYGSTRILNMINYDIIINNPKFFVGFSDITAIHIAFNQIANLITFHGVMALTSPTWDNFTYNSLINSLNMDKYLNIENPICTNLKTLIAGKCEGRIVGGNLSLIISTMGTNYEINTKGKILFIEETNECIYKIDRMITQLILSRKIQDCNGLIFGDFNNCNKQQEEEFSLVELLKDRLIEYNKPCIYNLKSGHCMPMVTLPLGVSCKLDSLNKKIELFK